MHKQACQTQSLRADSELCAVQAYTGIYQADSEYRSLKAVLDTEMQRQADQRKSLESAQSLETSTQEEQEQQGAGISECSSKAALCCLEWQDHAT